MTNLIWGSNSDLLRSMRPIPSRVLKPAALALLQRGVALTEVQNALHIPIDLTDGGQEVTKKQALDFLEYYVAYFESSDASASSAYVEHLNLSAFGPVGFAMMSAPTLGQTLATLMRYKHSVAPAILADITVEMDDGSMALRFVLGEYSQPIREFIMELSLAFVDLVRQQLVQRDWSEYIHKLHLAHRPKADFIKRAENAIPGVPIEYGQADNRAWGDLRALSLPLIAGNAETFEMLCDQLEQLHRLELLKNDDTANNLLKTLQECALGGVFLNLSQAAEKMHMSSRTLTRKLDRQASSFQMIHDYVRAGLACKLLRSDQTRIKMVAHRSGFSSEAGFSRTFKKWFRVTPLEYRSNKSMHLPRLQLTRTAMLGTDSPPA